MSDKKPNIVLIFADDLGYGDVSCFNENSKVKTKHLEGLAESGMIFTNTHATSALCTPSRYGLLTGRYNWRSKLKSYVLPGDSMPLIEEDRRTLAHMLKDAGYQTAAIGKWHLGLGWQLTDEPDFEKYGLDPEDFPRMEKRHGRDGIFDVRAGLADFEGLDIDYSKPITFGPNELGFDYFFGTPASLDQPPFVYIENDRVTAEPDGTTGVSNLDRLGPSNQTQWQNGVIAPDFVHEEVPDVMQEKALETIDKFTEGDDPFFLYYPNHLVHGPLLPNKEFKGKSGIGLYGDFILQLDHYIGEIIDKLKEMDIFDETIFIFTSDNGASGVAGFEALHAKGHYPNHIFKGAKGDIWEGGHREPTIISYPPAIEAGGVSNHLISLSDLYRTIAELIDANVPDNAAEDSYSLSPIFEGRTEEVREDVVHSSANGGLAIRRGKWKLDLVEEGGGMGVTQKQMQRGEQPTFEPTELYDLEADIREQHNVIDEHPDLVEDMVASLAEYVRLGRSTPGEPQENEGGNDWPQFGWIEEYSQYVDQFQYD